MLFKNRQNLARDNQIKLIREESMAKKYIILDTETTGVEEEDRIIQLAFLVIDENGKIEVNQTFCLPEQKISFKAMAVHHITPEQLSDKSSLLETSVYKRLLELNTEENFLIIQNAKFDLGMLAKEGFTNKMKLIDTFNIVRHILPELESHSQQYMRYALGLYHQEKELLSTLGIKEISAHDALGDILVLWLLFCNLKKIDNLWERVSRISNLDKELIPVGLIKENIQEFPIDDMFYILSQVPVLVKNFRFGKYKDKPIELIVRRDRSYIEWMLNKMDNLDDAIRYTIHFYMYPEMLSENIISIPKTVKSEPKITSKMSIKTENSNIDQDNSSERSFEQMTLFDD